MRILIFFVLSREKMLVTPLGILYGGLLLLGLVAALLYCLHIAQWGQILYKSRFKFDMSWQLLSKDHTNQVRIISIITRFNNNTHFFCFMQLGFVIGWPTLSFSQKNVYPSLKVILFQKRLTKDYVKQVQNFLLKH